MEELKIAAKWWADQLRGTPKQDNGEPLQSALASICAGMIPRPDEAGVMAFEDSLFGGLTNWLQENERLWRNCGLTISVDYHPDAILSAAARKSGINLAGGLLLPMKTMMRVERGVVQVACGYGAPFAVIYGEAA